ncbi:hypothetical protein GCM10009760_35650 [Kitasatospora kazusensis]|uniref:Uncharacterized protein n=1 Tax=Kitasatospora kazusensis TaxID=407974 RepID=A0ABP5LFA7_9ACTN
MVDHRELFDEVCRAVERAGFGLASPGEAGLHVGHRPQGVVVSWRPGVGQTCQAVGHRYQQQYGRATAELPPVLAALLERVGHTVLRRDADLLITAGAPEPASGPAFGSRTESVAG